MKQSGDVTGELNWLLVAYEMTLLVRRVGQCLSVAARTTEPAGGA